MQLSIKTLNVNKYIFFKCFDHFKVSQAAPDFSHSSTRQTDHGPSAQLLAVSVVHMIHTSFTAPWMLFLALLPVAIVRLTYTQIERRERRLAHKVRLNFSHPRSRLFCFLGALTGPSFNSNINGS